MFVKISICGDEHVTHAQRKAYLRSMFGHDKNKGSIFKFASAHGYRPVMFDFFAEGGVINDPKVPSPEDYINPCAMLYRSIRADTDGNNIAQFILPAEHIAHPVAAYSYDGEMIGHKFAKFLKKVYPQLNIEVGSVDSDELDVAEFALDFFYTNLDFENPHYTVEFSSHRLLTDDEIERVYRVMDGATKYKWHIEQFECETCRSYHPDSPYHIMVVYD